MVITENEEASVMGTVLLTTFEHSGDGSLDNFLKASTLKNNRMRFINLLCFVVRGKSRVQETTA